jgi:hypothetical protein
MSTPEPPPLTVAASPLLRASTSRRLFGVLPPVKPCMAGSLVAGGAQARASPHLVACTTGGGRTAAQGRSAATMAWARSARRLAWAGQASQPTRSFWLGRRCELPGLVCCSLGAVFAQHCSYFSNFEFRYSFNYSRNQFKLPKFVGNYRNFRKIKT